MGALQHDFVKARNRSIVDIDGYITGTGASAPTITAQQRGVASIARSGVGLYNITLEEQFPFLESWGFGVMDAGPNSWTFALTAFSATAGALSIACYKAGTLTDLPAGVLMSFLFKFQNTTVK
jgi:hypothetical protein